MRSMTTTGRFITFEGGEGSGKSTQVHRLAERLRLHGIEVVETREPGGSPGAEAIRHLLLAGVAKPLGSEAEAMLFAAARDDHMTATIRPALQRGAWVICDRFIDSTRVYQGALGNVDRRLIHSLERLVVGPDMPDLTLVLDLDPNIGLTRVTKRGEATNRFEDENFEFHKQLRVAYRDIAEHEPGRCVLIDADANPDVVAVRIWMAVSERLLRPLRAGEPARVAG
jgi:dTMP kinase